MIKTTIDFEKPIQFGTGWNCCIGLEAFVIVFENGVRWAVCFKCANKYTGSKFSLAIFNPEDSVYSYKYLTTMYN